jgi:hypothetical protein
VSRESCVVRCLTAPSSPQSSTPGALIDHQSAIHSVGMAHLPISAVSWKRFVPREPAPASRLRTHDSRLVSGTRRVIASVVKVLKAASAQRDGSSADP